MKTLKICCISVNERVIEDFLVVQMNKLKEKHFNVTYISSFNNTKTASEKYEAKCIDLEIPRGISPLKMLYSIFKLYKLFKLEQFDIIQYTGPSTSLCCSLAGKLARIKYRIYCQWGLRFEGFVGSKKFLFMQLEKLTCYLSSQIILDSKLNREKELKLKLLPERKCIIIKNGSTNGVDIEKINTIDHQTQRLLTRKKYRIPESVFVVGYLGRVARDKGIDDLMEAIIELHKRESSIWFVIAGFEDSTDPISKELKNKVMSLGHTLFLGRVERPELILPCFDLFVFPSYREGYGGGCLQAGAFGLTSVATNILPIYESLNNGEFGILISPHSPKMISGAIATYFQNSEGMKREGEKYKKWVNANFDRRDWLTEYVQTIENIVTDKPVL